MAKRPNKMGRIEADPKPKKNIPWKPIAVLTVGVALIVTGVAGTLKYQSFIAGVKSQGAAEYRLMHCEKYTDKEVAWLECDE